MEASEVLKAEVIRLRLDWSPSYLYQNLLSVADGSKVGGYVNWLQDPEIPTCECNHAMEHLLTISDAEFDGGSYFRWCPIEYQQLPPKERRWIQTPLGITLGDMGKLYIFTCNKCPEWPIKAITQWS